MNITYTQRYEFLAELYRARYGRLAPGKDDKFRDSCSLENKEQWENWLINLAFTDLIAHAITLQNKLDEANETIEKQNDHEESY